jgi:YD repeat-containing protein
MLALMSRRVSLRLVLCFACCLTAVCFVSGSAALAAPITPPASGESLPTNPLVVPEDELLTGSDGAGEAQEAKLASPAEVVAREESTTKYRGLSTSEAKSVAERVFPALMSVEAGGPPTLPVGQRITGFAGEFAAQAELGGGQSGLVTSMEPMALPAGGGGWSAIDLGLHEAQGVFVAGNPLVEVRLPKHLDEGVQLPVQGLSVTPVDGQAQALGGAEGVIAEKAAFYANSQTDTDTVVKPSTLGFEVDTLLRSPASPDEFEYRVGLPSGASLVSEPGVGGVRVVKEGATLASIPAPSAYDAAGVDVPVLMSVTGDVIKLSVDDEPGRVTYPVDVDPEFNARGEYLSPWNWHFDETANGFTHSRERGKEGGGGYLSMKHTGSFPTGEWETVWERSNGSSKIYYVATYDSLWYAYNVCGSECRERTVPYLSAYAAIYNKTDEPEYTVVQFAGNPYVHSASVCANEECSPAGGSHENSYEFTITTLEPSSNYSSSEWDFGAELESATVTYISQPKEIHSEATLNTTYAKLKYKVGSEERETANVLYDEFPQWIGPSSEGVFEAEYKDAGVGIAKSELEVYNSKTAEWELIRGKNYTTEESKNEQIQDEPLCEGIQCPAALNEVFSYSMVGEYRHGYDEKTTLPNGEDKIRAAANDAMEHTSSDEHREGEAVIKVDSEAPYNIVISGLVGKGSEYELGEVETTIKAEATDGKEGTPSSGIKALELAVDGRTVGKPSGSCPAGPCTAHGEWSINGAELGAGVHTLTVQAVDNADNYADKPFTLTVYHASPVAMGPGSVNPESGDFALESSDVAVSGGEGALAVTRHYDSRNLKEGEEGPLGPQWAIGLGSLASLEVLPDKSVMVIGSEGLTHFTKSGSSYVAPKGDTNLMLRAEENKEKQIVAFYLEDATAGTSTKFTLPAGANAWMPTTSKGPSSTNTMTDEYKSVEIEKGKMVIEPTLEVAPHPNTTCEVGKLEKGCRALEFVYAKETTAKEGEARVDWGSYKNHLVEVVFVAWNPAATPAKMVSTPVARYEYDVKGRLRAEWNPSLPSELKTYYGYDSEGHVTAITPPGRETSVFVYGTIASDGSDGRLIKATQAPASAVLWAGEAVKNSEAPKLSGTPAVGVRMSVSNGVWSGSPVVYGYQWEDCNIIGQSCTPILGATNQNYTPASSDVGHTLVAQVTAINGDGSVVVSSAASLVVSVKAGSYEQGLSGSLTAVSCVPGTTDCVIGNSEGSARYATNVSTSGPATWKEWRGPEEKEARPSEAVACPTTSVCVLADHGHIYYATVLGGSWTLAVSPSYAADAISCASSSFCVAGEGETFQGENDGYIRYSTEPASSEWTPEKIGGKVNINGVSCVSSSFCAAVDPDGKVYVATSASQIKSTSWKETDVDGTTKLDGIACTSTTSCVAVDSSGNALKLTIESGGGATAAKHDIDGTTSLVAVACTGSTTCVAVDGSGNVFVSKNSGETWTKEYALGDKPTSVACASGSLCATVDTSGDVAAFNPAGEKGTEGENDTPQPGATIEYGVPLQGTGAPQQMGVNETTKRPEPEKWGQHDDPEYATSIFTPDNREGWPASNNKGATTYYFDGQARTTNIANAAGGVSTTEYNEENQVTRTLSADNRVTALKEECKTEKECKSAEIADVLETKNSYNEEGQLTDTRGPQHTVKLAVGKEGKKGEEVLARNHVHYDYDEDAPGGETYDLVTKEIDGAETTNGEEFDKRVATTSYSGQSDLGWKLRKATSQTTDPAGLDLTSSTEYNSEGDVVETKSPAGTSQAVYPPVFSGSFGSEGSGSGKFNHPEGVAIDASGDVWVADKNNNRVEEFSSSGSLIAAYGSSGTGDLQFSGPWGIAINQTTNEVYVSDTNNNRIEVLKTNGEFVDAFGWGVKDGKEELEVCTTACKAGLAGSKNGELDEPLGLTVGANGDVWVAEYANNRIQKFSATGGYLGQFGSKGSGEGQLAGPSGVVIVEGELYVSDTGNNRVVEFSPNGTYRTEFGTSGSGEGQFKEPLGIAVNATTGDLYVSDTGNNRVQEVSPAGKFLAEFGHYGTGEDEFHAPTGIAINSSGELYIADEYNARVDEWLPPGTGGQRLIYSAQFGSSGSGKGQFNFPGGVAVDGQGNVWVSDYNNNRIEEFTGKGTFLNEYGSAGKGQVQFEGPTGIAVNQSTGNVYIGDCRNDRIQELSSTGTYVRSIGSPGSEAGELGCPSGVKIDSSGDVWVADSEHDRIEEYSSTGTFIATYGKKGAGEAQFEDPVDLAFVGSDIYVADHGNNRIEELNNTTGAYVGQFGKEGSESGQFKGPEAIAADAAGNLYVVDNANNRIQEFSSTGAFEGTYGSYGSGEGQLHDPEQIAVNAAGEIYVADSDNNRLETWMPDNQAAHDTRTIYYTAKEEAEPTACRNHPEWVGLPCQTLPVAQSGVSGMPELPTKTISYNMWDKAEQIVEAFGTTERATKTEFSAGGLAVATEETSSNDKAMPKITDKYNTSNGMLEEQSTTVGEKTQTVTNKYNRRGELESYTDASGDTTTYTYNEDGQVTKVKDGSDEGKGEQAYTYSEETGELTELLDAGAGTFTAGYDKQGKMTSVGYPNGMTASYTYNTAGAATMLEYKKVTHCTENCTWFKDSLSSSIHGEALSQNSTLAGEEYTYDSAGRLTQVQETPSGEGCTTRAYTYSEDSDRTRLATSKPNGEGKCSVENPVVEAHTYDSADQMTDEGTTYEAFGNTTKLPAVDAGSQAITSEYYVDGQVYKQTQNGQTSEYKLDPEDRVLETKASATVTDHYDAPGNSIAWTSEPGKWERRIPGIEGGLAAIQTGTTKANVTLQLHDLQGNIVATVEDSETATGLLTKYNSTEFGVPNSKGEPPKYAYQGASGITSEGPTGRIVQDGITYVPQTGTMLEPPEDLAPATPTNHNEAYVSNPNNPADQAGAQEIGAQIAKREQENREREEAERPAGEVPAGGAPTLASGESREEGRIEWGHGEPVATAAAFNRTFLLTPGEALAASEAITAVHHGVVKAPFFPEWANKMLTNMPYVDWDKLASDLATASSATTPFGIVEVTVEGSLNPRHFHVFVLVTAKGAEGFPDG